MLDDGKIAVVIQVPLDMAINGNYGRHGAVSITVDLSTLTPEQKELMLSWGNFSRQHGRTVLAHTKLEWLSEDNARRGFGTFVGIPAHRVPPSIDDLWAALEARRDREPQEMQYAKVAFERRTFIDHNRKRSWWSRLWNRRQP